MIEKSFFDKYYMSMDKEKIFKILQDNMRTIKQFGVSNIGLFGYYAQYRDKKESDIDILIHFKKGKKSFDNYMDLKFFLEDLLEGHKVDLVIDDALKPALKERILETVKYAT